MTAAVTNTARQRLKIGWIGTGVMGLPMCKHCLDYGGHTIYVCNRSPSKYASLIKSTAAAIPCATPRLMASTIPVELIVTMIGYPKDVEDVVFGPQGVLQGLKERPEELGKPIFVDMSTGSPALTQRIAAALGAAGVTALDAPVSGGDIGAQEARLSVMVGGAKEKFEKIRETFFECVAQPQKGGNIVWAGDSGFGQHMKLANQILIATSLVGVCESLLYSYRAKLNPEVMLEAVSRGAAGSWSLTNLAPRILRRDFEPGFFVHHFVKDMEIALDECRRLNLALPGLALVHQLFVALKASGHSEKGTQALILALEALNNVRLPDLPPGAADSVTATEKPCHY